MYSVPDIPYEHGLGDGLLNLDYSRFFQKFKVGKESRIFLASILILAGFSLFVPIQLAMATVTVTWDFSTGHSTNDGGVNALVPRVFFTVNDTSLINGKQDTISVKVNSTSDQNGITLTIPEDPGDTGIFTNTNLIFTNGPSQFHLSDTAIVNLNDSSGNIDPTQVDFVPNSALPFGLLIFSTSDPAGISFFVKETGNNTGIFSNPVTFTSGPSVTNSSIQANNGDIISIFNQDTGQFQNWLIIPNPNSALDALPANEGDNVTAIYNGVKDQTRLDAASGGGGGGGGLIQPGLVLDILAAIGGSPFIVSPPSFGGAYYHYSDGLTITQGTTMTTFDTSKYNQEIPKQVMIEGQKVNMTFKTFESYNPTAVIHMGLYIIPRGQDMLTTNSIASIVYDKNSPVEVNDPNHILSNASVSSTSDGKFQYTQFSFVPTKSYDKMSFLVRAWNDHLYSTDVRVHDEIIQLPSPKILPTGVFMYDNFNDLQAALEKDKFYKSPIMAHIHSTTDVFSSTDAGHLYWLYDTINHTVTLVIEDKNDNELYSYKGTLDPFVQDKKGDYGFMHFTVKQLNREDEQQEKQAMEIEAAKALFLALENGMNFGNQ
ncbi:MAG: hypothetical protein HY223_03415 [Thaumarchaeota archaeon]|nr:hypothetical protein [Nitrososphaerota archaeon]